MSLFHKKNQSFTTIDILSLVLLVGAVGSISGAILAEAFHPETMERTEALAEILAHQLATQQLQARTQVPVDPESHRGPASVQQVQPAPPLTSGTIGKDSWAHPFHYLVHEYVASKTQRPTFRIFVWSDGPDGKADSDPNVFVSAFMARSPETHQPGVRLKFKLGGDDVGYSEDASDELMTQSH
jgi:hypothetical protein